MAAKPRIIAIEEHYWDREVAATFGPMDDMRRAPAILERLYDYAELRIKEMDEAGIDMQVLSQGAPSTQRGDAELMVKLARGANDRLREMVRAHPDRFGAFAALPTPDPKAAADELERCMRELKLCGAMINGHTNGQYLDDPALTPFWERAEALGALIYLHPADPVAPLAPIAGYKILSRPMWGWGVETGSHALRMVVSGLFERFPKAKLAIGHLGETLPYLLWRFDSRAKMYGWKLPKPPSQYIKDNIWVTLSGMFSAEPLTCAVSALGRDRVMFSADHPFENAEEAGHFMDSVPLDESLRADIAYNNAAKLLGLS